jgi:hypothetical protein
MTGQKPVGRRWTAAEEKQLQGMLDAGETAAEVAREAEAQTRQAIYTRLQHQAVPELTQNTAIQLNGRVSLRPPTDALPYLSAGRGNGSCIESESSLRLVPGG